MAKEVQTCFRHGSDKRLSLGGSGKGPQTDPPLPGVVGLSDLHHNEEGAGTHILFQV